MNTIADLVMNPQRDLLKMRKFGKKSLREIEDFVASKGLSFRMDIKRYRLPE